MELFSCIKFYLLIFSWRLTKLLGVDELLWSFSGCGHGRRFNVLKTPPQLVVVKCSSLESLLLIFEMLSIFRSPSVVNTGGTSNTSVYDLKKIPVGTPSPSIKYVKSNRQFIAINPYDAVKNNVRIKTYFEWILSYDGTGSRVNFLYNKCSTRELQHTPSIGSMTTITYPVINYQKIAVPLREESKYNISTSIRLSERVVRIL